MGVSTWYRKQMKKRRENILSDYRKLFKKYSNKSIIITKLALKYHLSEVTIRSDLKAARNEQT